MIYNKPALSISEQVDLLEQRGLEIADRSRAESYLSSISYYRLSAYMYPFKDHAANTFLSGSTFDKVLDSYVFDRELRLLVFDAIERIEIAFRTQAIYQPSMALGAFWYQDRANFTNGRGLHASLRLIDEKVEKSNETFMKHFKKCYHGSPRPPSWMVFEICSFGLITTLCLDLKDYAVRTNIANHFGFPGTQRHIFESWIQCLVYVRNICAHHSRLWNRTLTKQPAVLVKTQHPWIDQKAVSNRKMYYFLSVLSFLLQRIIPETSFPKKLKELIEVHPDVDLTQMDFPENWQSEPLWLD